MLFNYLQRALQHLNSHTPKLSSADLALLVYTSGNLDEVKESGLKGAWRPWLTPVQLGFDYVFHFLPRFPRSVNQSAGCQWETGWRLAGDALLSCSFDPPSLGFLGARGWVALLCALSPFPSFNTRSC